MIGGDLMTKVNLPYLMRQRDRQGRWVWYVRRNGKKTRLRSEPGTPAFLAAYQEAIQRGERSAENGTGAQKMAPAHTWRWLCMTYFATPEFGELAPETRVRRHSVLESTWAEPIAPGSARLMGDFPLDQFNSKAVRVLRDRRAAHPAAANHRLRAISGVFRWATEADHTASNPAVGVPSLRSRNPAGHHTWSVAEVELYRERHLIGTKARLALELLLFTGTRRSDAVRLGRPMVVDGSLVWTEAKSMARQPKSRIIPILPELQVILAATTLTGRDTWLVTQYGKPFSSVGFSNWFRIRCDEASLPHCSAHGLRKAGATIAAENGATDRQLMAIFGWTTSKQVTTYTSQADKRRLAHDAMRLLVSKE